MGNDQSNVDTVIRLIAHDLRNPLTAVQLNAQLIERAANNEGRSKDVRWASLIISSARRLERMIQLLVEAERLRSGRLAMALERLAFPGWLAAWLPGAALGFDRKRLQVTVDDAAIAIMADGNRLKSVITTLLEVAAQGSAEEAPIRLEARPDGSTLRCLVRVSRHQATQTAAIGQLTAGNDIEIHWARAVLEVHHGELQVVDADDGSAGFDVVLPAHGG